VKLDVMETCGQTAVARSKTGHNIKAPEVAPIEEEDAE
jgi:hypothetical protein